MIEFYCFTLRFSCLKNYSGDNTLQLGSKCPVSSVIWGQNNLLVVVVLIIYYQVQVLRNSLQTPLDNNTMFYIIFIRLSESFNEYSMSYIIFIILGESFDKYNMSYKILFYWFNQFVNIILVLI